MNHEATLVVVVRHLFRDLALGGSRPSTGLTGRTSLAPS